MNPRLIFAVAAIYIMAAVAVEAAPGLLDNFGFDRTLSDFYRYLITEVDHNLPAVTTLEAVAIFRQVPESIDGHRVASLAASEGRGKTFLRNEACWPIVDLTPIAACQFDIDPRRQTWTAQLGVTLISPRHVLMAKHANIAKTEIIFVSRDNRIVRRRSIDMEPVLTEKKEASGAAAEPDFCIGLLDRPIDLRQDGIDFARVLPLDYIAKNLHGVLRPFIPVLYTNQDREIRVFDWIANGATNSTCDVFFTRSPDAKRAAFYKAARPGDSGSPIFVAVDGHIALLSVFHTPAQGSSVPALRGEIEIAMAALERRHENVGAYHLVDSECQGFERAQ